MTRIRTKRCKSYLLVINVFTETSNAFPEDGSENKQIYHELSGYAILHIITVIMSA